MRLQQFALGNSTIYLCFKKKYLKKWFWKNLCEQKGDSKLTRKIKIKIDIKETSQLNIAVIDTIVIT